MSLESLFSEYLKGGIYLKGWSPKTPLIYQRAFTSRDIKRLCASLGISGDYVRPHCFRHFFAGSLHQRG